MTLELGFHTMLKGMRRRNWSQSYEMGLGCIDSACVETFLWMLSCPGSCYEDISLKGKTHYAKMHLKKTDNFSRVIFITD